MSQISQGEEMIEEWNTPEKFTWSIDRLNKMRIRNSQQVPPVLNPSLPF